MKKYYLSIFLFLLISIVQSQNNAIIRSDFNNGINCIRDTSKKTLYFNVKDGIIKGQYIIMKNAKTIERGYIDNSIKKHFRDTINSYILYYYKSICIGCKFKDSSQLYSFINTSSLKIGKKEEFYENGKLKSTANFRIEKSKRDTNAYESVLIDTCFTYYQSGKIESINYLTSNTEIGISYYENGLMKYFSRSIDVGKDQYDEYVSFFENEQINKMIFRKNGKLIVPEYQYTTDRKHLYMRNNLNLEIEVIDYNKAGKIKKILRAQR